MIPGRKQMANFDEKLTKLTAKQEKCVRRAEEWSKRAKACEEQIAATKEAKKVAEEKAKGEG